VCVCVFLGEEANRKGTAVGRSIGMASRLIANTPFLSRWPGGRIECMLQYRSRNNLLQKWVSTPPKPSARVLTSHPPSHSHRTPLPPPLLPPPSGRKSMTTMMGHAHVVKRAEKINHDPLPILLLPTRAEPPTRTHH